MRHLELTPQQLTDREREVFRELEAFCRQADAHPDWHAQWAKPMDVGGRDGSHHSYTLSRLVAKGLVERRPRGAASLRGSWQYRVKRDDKARL